PDRPHRLVGQDDPGDGIGREAGQPRAQLAFDRRGRQALSPLVGRLTDAENGSDAVHEGGLDLAIDLIVRLAHLTTALGVPDEDIAATHLDEHGQGDLTGVRPGGLPVAILGAESQWTPAQDLVDRGQRGGRRAGHDLRSTRPFEAITDCRGQRPSLGDGPLHLPVANAEWSPHQRASVRASTPGSVRPSRNSRNAPPAVEMYPIRSATRARFTEATVSPPPMTENARLSTTARARAMETAARGAFPKNPL